MCMGTGGGGGRGLHAGLWDEWYFYIEQFYLKLYSTIYKFPLRIGYKQAVALCKKKHGKIELAMKVTGIDIHKSVYYVTLEKVIDPISRTWTSIHPDCLCVWSQNVSPHLFIPPTNKIGMSIRLLMSAHLLHFVRIFVHLLSIFCSKADHDQKMCYDPKQGHLVNFNIIGKDRFFKFCPGHFL